MGSNKRRAFIPLSKLSFKEAKSGIISESTSNKYGLIPLRRKASEYISGDKTLIAQQSPSCRPKTFKEIVTASINERKATPSFFLQ